MKIDRLKSSSLTLTSSVGLKPKPANFRPGRLLATKKTLDHQCVFFMMFLLGFLQRPVKQFSNNCMVRIYNLHHYNEAIPKSMSSRAGSEGMK